MEYIFGYYDNGTETVKTKDDVHSDLKGFQIVSRDYEDCTIVDSFYVIKKTASNEDVEGMCYDWYLIDKHSRYVDKTKCIKPELDAKADLVDGKVPESQLPQMGINKNMLDNWYFGNPVDQRGGYVIPPGCTYYTFSWEAVGTTDKYYRVLFRRDAANNYDCEIEVNGTHYVVAGGDAVRGYTGAGYGIDRWKIGTGSIVIEKDCVQISNLSGSSATNVMSQPLEPNGIVGKTVTLSFLFSDNTLLSVFATLEQKTSWTSLASTNDGLKEIRIVGIASGLFSAECRVMTASPVKPVAAKLELGTEQTLAHQDENGVWVLNEIPNFHEELLKCIQSTADSADTYANKSVATTGDFSIITMSASKWSNNQYSFESTYPKESYDISIEVAPTATVEQFEAFGEAMICGSHNSNVAKALNGAPTVDIPVIVKVVAK